MSLSSQKLQRVFEPSDGATDSDPFALSPEQEERLRKQQVQARRNRRCSRIKRIVSGLFDLLFAAAFAAAVGIQAFALMHTQLTK